MKLTFNPFRIHLLFILAFMMFITTGVKAHRPQAFLDQVKNTPNEGQKIAEHFCMACHAEQPMIALGAPKQGNTADWAPRVAQGLNILFKHSNEGIRAMPPRGGCFECTDAQLMLAIKALLPQELDAKLEPKL